MPHRKDGLTTPTRNALFGAWTKAEQGFRVAMAKGVCRTAEAEFEDWWGWWIAQYSSRRRFQRDQPEARMCFIAEYRRRMEALLCVWYVNIEPPYLKEHSE